MAKLKAMVVDDMYANQFLLASILEGMGCSFSMASNGKEVFDLLESEGLFDIIFMDIEMPVMNGIEATQKLISDPRYKNIPVVALTAHNIEDFYSEYDGVGFSRVIEKPLTFDGIADIIDKLGL